MFWAWDFGGFWRILVNYKSFIPGRLFHPRLRAPNECNCMRKKMLPSCSWHVQMILCSARLQYLRACPHE